jgi:hypothetical protein
MFSLLNASKSNRFIAFALMAMSPVVIATSASAGGIPAGAFKWTDGGDEIYYSNGRRHYCHYSPAVYAREGRPAPDFYNRTDWRSGMRFDGRCR